MIKGIQKIYNWNDPTWKPPKSAWQNEEGMYAVKTQFSDEEPKMLSEEELEKLMELMQDYNFMIFENPIYQETINPKP